VEKSKRKNFRKIIYQSKQYGCRIRVMSHGILDHVIVADGIWSNKARDTFS